MLAIGELIFSIFSQWPSFALSPCGTALVCGLESPASVISSQLIFIMQREER